MKWVLILVVVNQQGLVDVVEQQSYENMIKCYQHKEFLLDSLGDPFNYQSICIPTNIKLKEVVNG